MKKQAILLLTILTVAGAGCNLQNPHTAFREQMQYDFEQLKSRMDIWRQDWDENEQKIKSNLTQLESILGQQTSLLETLSNDEQIQPADFQLYKDFLVFIQNSNDQIKTYEFIEKMRAVLPSDKMERITELHLQLKQNKDEFNSLQKQKDVLKERLDELDRQNQETKQRWDQQQQWLQQQDFQQRLLLRQQLNSY